MATASICLYAGANFSAKFRIFVESLNEFGLLLCFDGPQRISYLCERIKHGPTSYQFGNHCDHAV